MKPSWLVLSALGNGRGLVVSPTVEVASIQNGVGREAAGGPEGTPPCPPPLLL